MIFSRSHLFDVCKEGGEEVLRSWGRLLWYDEDDVNVNADGYTRAAAWIKL